MAFDGITISAIAKELSDKLTGSHVRKIAQPESDELMLTLQTPAPKRDTYKLKLSANASLPLIYISSESKPSPLTAPNFCMLLRKHISGAAIGKIYQSGFERCIRIVFETKNELNDNVTYSLSIEVMGKHSNIIFLDDKDMIIDSIKHINSFMSSVREVLPGREYFIPNTMDKIFPFDVDTDTWNSVIFIKPMSVAKAISSTVTGLSMVMCHEICYRTKIDGDRAIASLNGNEKSSLINTYKSILDIIEKYNYSPVIYYDKDMPKEFSTIELTMYDELKSEHYESVSEMVERFYSEKDALTRIHSKTAELKSTVKTYHERAAKKIDILHKQLKDTEKMDKFKVYGELINTYGYTELPTLPLANSSDDSLKLHCINYHDDAEVDIPIDASLTVSDNANKYFDKYNKLKRTKEAVDIQLKESTEELEHLDSILTEIDLIRKEEDISTVRAELVDNGYLKTTKDKRNKKQLPKSKPLHFISSDGYDIYVGKNNYQNDDITFHIATGNDWWFHAKKMPGSHVIVLSHGEEPPIHTFEEAAALSALFSKGSMADKLEIDYTQKKNVKKPSGSKPGFVVYYTNYSMTASREYLKRVKPATKEEEAYL